MDGNEKINDGILGSGNKILPDDKQKELDNIITNMTKNNEPKWKIDLVTSRFFQRFGSDVKKKEETVPPLPPASSISGMGGPIGSRSQESIFSLGYSPKKEKTQISSSEVTTDTISGTPEVSKPIVVSDEKEAPYTAFDEIEDFKPSIDEKVSRPRVPSKEPPLAAPVNKTGLDVYNDSHTTGVNGNRYYSDPVYQYFVNTGDLYRMDDYARARNIPVGKEKEYLNLYRYNPDEMLPIEKVFIFDKALQKYITDIHEFKIANDAYNEMLNSKEEQRNQEIINEQASFLSWGSMGLLKPNPNQVEWMARADNYLGRMIEGGRKHYEIGGANFFRTLDNASKFMYDVLKNATFPSTPGVPSALTFEDVFGKYNDENIFTIIAEFIENVSKKNAEVPNDVVGRAVASASEMSELFLEMGIAPNTKIAWAADTRIGGSMLAKALSGVGEKVLADGSKQVMREFSFHLPVTLFGAGFVNKNNELREQDITEYNRLKEDFKAGGVGFLNGLAYTFLGYKTGVFGQKIGAAAKKDWVGYMGGTIANASGFGGLTALETLIATGKWDGPATLDSFAMGLVLPLWDIPKYLHSRAVMTWATTPTGIVKKLSKFKWDVNNLRSAKDELLEMARKEKTKEGKKAIASLIASLDNIADVTVVNEEILLNPQTHIEGIKNDPLMTSIEKAVWIKKINELVNYNSAFVEESKPYVEQIERINDEQKRIDEDETIPEIVKLTKLAKLEGGKLEAQARISELYETKVKPKQEGEQNAGEIRENKGIIPESGQKSERGERIGSKNVQQTEKAGRETNEPVLPPGQTKAVKERGSEEKKSSAQEKVGVQEKMTPEQIRTDFVKKVTGKDRVTTEKERKDVESELIWEIDRLRKEKKEDEAVLHERALKQVHNAPVYSDVIISITGKKIIKPDEMPEDKWQEIKEEHNELSIKAEYDIDQLEKVGNEIKKITGTNGIETWEDYDVVRKKLLLSIDEETDAGNRKKVKELEDVYDYLSDKDNVDLNKGSFDIEKKIYDIKKEKVAEPVVEEKQQVSVKEKESVKPVVEKEKVAEPVVEEKQQVSVKEKEPVKPVVEKEKVAEPVVEEKKSTKEIKEKTAVEERIKGEDKKSVVEPVKEETVIVDDKEFEGIDFSKSDEPEAVRDYLKNAVEGSGIKVDVKEVMRIAEQKRKSDRSKKLMAKHVQEAFSDEVGRRLQEIDRGNYSDVIKNDETRRSRGKELYNNLKPVNEDYYIAIQNRNDNIAGVVVGNKKFVKVSGAEPLKISGSDVDLFIYRTDSGFYSIVEAKSGLEVKRANTKNNAIKLVTEEMGVIKKSTGEADLFGYNMFDKDGSFAISPRYTFADNYKPSWSERREMESVAENSKEALEELKEGRGVIYTGVFLNEESRSELLKEIEPTLPNVKGEHSTITFRPALIEWQGMKFGDEIELKVVGVAGDDKVQAVVVENPLSDNKIPHITISVADGVKPVESNNLLAKGYKKLDKPIILRGRIGAMTRNGLVTKNTFKEAKEAPDKQIKEGNITRDGTGKIIKVAPQNMKELAIAWKEIFGLSNEQANLNAALYQASADRWARDNKSTSEEWYKTHIAEIRFGTIKGKKVYYQEDKIEEKFYSNTLKAIEEIKDGKYGKDQWLGMLKKTSAKPNEMAWVGLEFFLNGKKGAVSKADVIDYFTNHRITVKNIIKVEGGGGIKSDVLGKKMIFFGKSKKTFTPITINTKHGLAEGFILREFPHNINPINDVDMTGNSKFMLEERMAFKDIPVSEDNVISQVFLTLPKNKVFGGKGKSVMSVLNKYLKRLDLDFIDDALYREMMGQLYKNTDYYDMLGFVNVRNENEAFIQHNRKIEIIGKKEGWYLENAGETKFGRASVLGGGDAILKNYRQILVTLDNINPDYRFDDLGVKKYELSEISNIERDFENGKRIIIHNVAGVSTRVITSLDKNDFKQYIKNLKESDNYDIVIAKLTYGLTDKVPYMIDGEIYVVLPGEKIKRTTGDKAEEHIRQYLDSITRSHLIYNGSQRDVDWTRFFKDYKAGHWDEPNVLVHFRVSDRDNVLYIEEIQSDWGQNLRKEYIKEKNKGKRITREQYNERVLKSRDVYDKMLEIKGKLFDIIDNKVKDVNDINELKRKIEYDINHSLNSSYTISTTYYNLGTDFEKLVGVLHGYGVELSGRLGDVGVNPFLPSEMPFEKNWHELAVKTAILQAIKEGKDGIALSGADIQYVFNQSERILIRKEYSPVKTVGGTEDINSDKDYKYYIESNQGQQQLQMHYVSDNEINRLNNTIQEYDYIRDKETLRRVLNNTVGYSVADKVDKIWEKMKAIQVDDTGIAHSVYMPRYEGLKKSYENIFLKSIKEIGSKFGINIEKIRFPYIKEAEKSARNKSYVGPFYEINEIKKIWEQHKDEFTGILYNENGEIITEKNLAERFIDNFIKKMVWEINNDTHSMKPYSNLVADSYELAVVDVWSYDVKNMTPDGFNNFKNKSEYIVTKLLGGELYNPKEKGYLYEANYLRFNDKLINEFTSGIPMFQEEGGIKRAATQMLNDNRVIISALTDPNVSSPLHELGHIHWWELTKEEQGHVLKWSKQKYYNDVVMEMFARGEEKYISEGKAPTKELEGVFKKFSQWLKDIYNGVIKNGDTTIVLNSKMRDIYDRLYGKIPNQRVGIRASKGKGFDAMSIGWDIDMRPQEDPNFKWSDLRNTVSLRNLTKSIANSLGIIEERSLRTGANIIKRFSRKAGALYFPNSGIIRIGNEQEFSRFCHEFGHKMFKSIFENDDFLKFVDLKQDLPIISAYYKYRKTGKSDLLDNMRAKYGDDIVDSVLHRIELREELTNLLASEKYPEKTLSEGNAEFVRNYIINPDRVRQHCPKFTVLFEDMLRSDKRLETVVKFARKQMEVFKAQDPMSVVSSVFVHTTRESWIEGIKTADPNKLMYGIMDNTWFARRLTELAKKHIPGKMEGEDNPFQQMLQLIGVDGMATQWLTNHPVRRIPGDVEILKDVQGLLPMLKNSIKDGDMYGYEVFLACEQGLSLHAIGVNLQTGKDVTKSAIATPEMLKAALELAEKRLGKENCKKHRENINKYYKALTDYLVDSEMVSREMVDDWMETRKYYVPLHKYFEEYESKGKNIKISRGLYEQAPVAIHSMRGSSRPIMGIYESIISDTYNILASAHRNYALKAIIKTLQGLDKTITKDNPLCEEIPIHDIERVVIDGKVRYVPKVVLPKNGNFVVVKENGKPKFYCIPKEYHDNFFAINEPLNKLNSYLASPTRWLQAGAVIFDPTFVARNIIRDQFTAFLYSRYGYNPLIHLVKGFAHIINKSDIYQKWLASGADQSFLTDMDRMLTYGYMERRVGSRLSTRWKIYKRNPLMLLQDMSKLSEMGTRVGAYDNAYRKTGNMYEAMQEAREITADYGIRGKYMKNWVGLYPFFNPRMQHLKMMGFVFSGRQGNVGMKFMKGITMMSVPTVLLWCINNGYNPLTGEVDEEKMRKWQATPSWAKHGLWHIPVTDNWRIPLPKSALGIIFGSPIEAFLDWAVGNDPRMAKTLIPELFKSASPIGNFSETMPQYLRLPAEQVYNVKGFTGKPVESPSMKGLESYEKYTESTTEIIKLFSKTMADILPEGAEKYTSPVRIEQFIASAFGGAGIGSIRLTDEGLQLIGVVNRKPEDTFTKLGKLPLIKAFIEPSPYGERSSFVSDFYDILDKLETVHTQAENYKAKGEYEKMFKYLEKKDNLKKNDWIEKQLHDDDGYLLWTDNNQPYTNMTNINYFKTLLSYLGDFRQDIMKEKEMSHKDKKQVVLEYEKMVTNIAYEFAVAYRENKEFLLPNVATSYLEKLKAERTQTRIEGSVIDAIRQFQLIKNPEAPIRKKTDKEAGDIIDAVEQMTK